MMWELWEAAYQMNMRSLRNNFGFNHSEILDLARSGIDAIFGGDNEKGRLRKLMWQ
jgi:hypothetical protein